MDSELLKQIDWSTLDRQLLQFFERRVPGEDAKDLRQDTFTTAFENWESFDPTFLENGDLNERVGAWLSSFAKYKLLEYFTKKRADKKLLERVAEQGLEILDETRIPYDSALSGDELLAAIKDCLVNCTPTLRDVARPYFQGKSYQEISSELRISMPTLYARISRLRKRLKKQLLRHRRRNDGPLVVYASEINLYQAVNQFIGDQEMTGCQWGDSNSQQNYCQFVDRMTNLDEDARNVLKQAREIVQSSELSAEDKKFVTAELNSFTKELQKKNSRSSRVRRTWKHIKEVSPTIASLLASAASLAKIIWG
jgi:RNA polymerase sigma factor (sigma-70 family)